MVCVYFTKIWFLRIERHQRTPSQDRDRIVILLKLEAISRLPPVRTTNTLFTGAVASAEQFPSHEHRRGTPDKLVDRYRSRKHAMIPEHSSLFSLLGRLAASNKAEKN